MYYKVCLLISDRLCLFLVIVPRPPRATLTYTHCPYTTLVLAFQVRYQRLSHSGVAMAGNPGQPCLDRIGRLRHRDEAAALHHLLDRLALFLDRVRIGI